LLPSFLESRPCAWKRTKKAIEIRDAVNAQQHGFAIDYELLGLDPAGGLHDQRVTLGPVVAVAYEQADTITIALNN